MKAEHVAIIHEERCIGCTKCIQACPVDAIVGAHQYMHTVIADECIGCELCITPCPMDCIEMVAAPHSELPREEKTKHAKLRVQARRLRLAREEEQRKLLEKTAASATSKEAIAEMIARAKAKKLRL